MALFLFSEDGDLSMPSSQYETRSNQRQDARLSLLGSCEDDLLSRGPIPAQVTPNAAIGGQCHNQRMYQSDFHIQDSSRYIVAIPNLQASNTNLI